jgi:hypothetical protein
VPSANSKILQQALAPGLKAAGFKKTSATWHRYHPAHIAVINLQGSQWGPSFYLNLGVYFVDLGDKPRPSEPECHIRSRLEAHVPDFTRVHQLLDFERKFELSARSQELASLLHKYGIPWLDRVATKAGAKEWCEKHPRSPFMADVLRTHLGLPSAPNKSLERTREG